MSDEDILDIVIEDFENKLDALRNATTVYEYPQDSQEFVISSRDNEEELTVDSDDIIAALKMYYKELLETTKRKKGEVK